MEVGRWQLAGDRPRPRTCHLRLPSFLLLAVLSATLLPSPPARAAEAEGAAADPATHAKVQAYVDLAAKLFRAGDYGGALEELQRADALEELAIVRFNIARCHEELRQPGQAIAAYRRYLATPDPGSEERRGKAQSTLARLEQEAAQSTGTLEVRCAPGGWVEVGGVSPAPEPCPFLRELAQAIYTVRVSRAGMQPAVTQVRVDPQKRSTVALEAQPVPAPPGKR